MASRILGMPNDVSQMLRLVREGRISPAELVPLLLEDLRRAAAALLRRERADHLLQATALVNEAYLRLVRVEQADWCDRAHFCAVAAHVMRQVLVDAARQSGRKKRGGDFDGVPLHSALLLTGSQPDVGLDLLDLDEALKRLAQISPRTVQVLEQRFFGGLTNEEVAAVLNLGVATVEREWRYARAWLQQRLADGGARNESESPGPL